MEKQGKRYRLLKELSGIVYGRGIGFVLIGRTGAERKFNVRICVGWRGYISEKFETITRTNLQVEVEQLLL